jgi:hypothetical protein
MEAERIRALITIITEVFISFRAIAVLHRMFTKCYGLTNWKKRLLFVAPTVA